MSSLRHARSRLCRASLHPSAILQMRRRPPLSSSGLAPPSRRQAIEYRPYDHQERVELPTEYTTTGDFEAQFQKFQFIDSFSNNLSALPHTETEALKWIRKNETRDAHRTDLGTQAAKNAYQKALEYAQALGYKPVVPCSPGEAQIYASSSNRKMGRIPTDDIAGSEKHLADADSEGWEQVGGSIFEYQPEDIKMTVAVNTSFYAL